MQNQPSVFNFTTQSVRVVMIDEAPWFVATDISDALGYPSAPQMTRNLDDDEKGMQIVHTLGGDQELSVISESGLYAAILKSRKPEAKKFKKWVTSEVLPAIRKTGKYVAPQAEYTGPVAKYVDLTSHPDFRHFAAMMEHRFWYGGSASHAVWANLRKIGGGCRATAFPESQVPPALEEIKRLAIRTDAFMRIKSDFERAAIKWVFGTDAQIIDTPPLPPFSEQLRLTA